MKVRKLQWLFPVAVTLHNLEEGISMPGWAARHAAQLPMQPPGAAKICFGLMLLTALAFVVTYFSDRKGRESIWAYLLFGYVAAMLLNVFVPHVPATFLFRSYTPGVITAVLINLPVMTILVVWMIREGWVSGWKAVVFAVFVPAGLAGMIVGLLLAPLW